MISDERRVLIFASTRRDAEVSFKLLLSSGFVPQICDTIDDLLKYLEDGSGCLLLAKETLIEPNLKRLLEFLVDQPAWSQLPIIILASTGDVAQARSAAMKMVKSIPNSTFLERPVRLATLVSVLEASLSDRARQYQVRDLVKELKSAKEDAERANKIKSEFLANMSHEIRTPLGAVLGFSELILEAELTAEDRSTYGRAIVRNGKHLLALVNDILDLAKVEAGKIEVEEIETSLQEIISEVVSAVHHSAEKRNVRLVVESAPLLPSFISTDPLRLKQILTNIVGNAVKFTENGLVKIQIMPERDAVDKPLLSFLVTDSGLGISEEQQAKLFRPFVQADSSTTRAYGGTGLGLVLSRTLSRALGGDLVLIRSQPNQGSTFKVTVGVGSSARFFKSETVRQDLPLSQTSLNIADMRVLLVEDSPDNQMLIGRILLQSGVRVETARDGIEGVSQALAGQFDVVLMDVQMPRLGGNEAAAELRKKGFIAPIIALTAHALKGDRERAIKSGFDDYLTKPVQKSELIATLAKYAYSKPIRL
jgi:signal transduction histidine kinase/ActR/RegA family two-component response regulator